MDYRPYRGSEMSLAAASNPASLTSVLNATEDIQREGYLPGWLWGSSGEAELRRFAQKWGFLIKDGDTNKR